MSSAEDQLIDYRLDGEVAVLGLNRPDKRNAINDALLDALERAVARAGTEARAGLIHGHGDHFCAGLDLAEHAGRDPFQSVRHSRRWHRVFDTIARGEIPWIAALHGAVIGGGLELAAAAHVRVAANDAFFALPEGQRGIFVGGGGAVRIARLIGAARMGDMMLTGRVIDAARAESWGLVEYVVARGEARKTALELARKAASNAPLSNFAILQALPRIQDMASDDGLFVESLISAFTQTSPEARALMTAFLEKRTDGRGRSDPES